ncbi:ficolin-1-like [Drosophila grimshawi]|uniref:ficolin-1-like n=1 Tax=Drosophila grimshawi TaxID=7222 RepID=UPI000C86E6FC|nr:ficolin-1-like [Drosophila grimshawi]
MLLKISCAIILLNILVAQCENLDEENPCKLQNITTKYAVEVSKNRMLLQSQLEEMRAEQTNLFAELNSKLDQLMVNSLRADQYPSSCVEVGTLSRLSGVYQIFLPGHSLQPFLVSCDGDTQGGGWTVILRRMDGSVNFFRYWNDYKEGFGNVNGEFFIGLDKLYAMTKDLNQELIIVMKNMAGQTKYAKYYRFAIGGEADLYNLRTLKGYSGNAGDSLISHVGSNFSSMDRDNDKSENNCAELYKGGWWYNKCHTSNLMGHYNESTFGQGINWLLFTGHKASLKEVQMMIRHTV